MMKFKILALFLTMMLSAALASNDAGATLVQYLAGTADPEAANVATGLEATPLTAGQTLPLVTGFSKPNNNAYFLLNNSDKGAPLLPTSKAAALEGDSYFEFTVTPEGGKSLDLSEITLQVGHEGSRTLGIQLVATVKTGDSLHEEDALFGSLAFYEAIEADSSSSKLPAGAQVDLSKLPRGITEPVTIRIYAFYELLKGTEIPPGYTDSIRIGDIVLKGNLR